MQREPTTLAEALAEIGRLRAEIERRAAADARLEQRLVAMQGMLMEGAATRLVCSALMIMRDAEVDRDLAAVRAATAALPVQLREEEFGQ